MIGSVDATQLNRELRQYINEQINHSIISTNDNHSITGFQLGTGSYIQDVTWLNMIAGSKPFPNLGQWCNGRTYMHSVQVVDHGHDYF